MVGDLHKRLDAVHDKASFLEFIRALVDDRRVEAEEEAKDPSGPWGGSPNGWANATIDSFLDAAVAWAEPESGLDSAGSSVAPRRAPDWFPEDPSWQSFARFLYAGKIYE